MIHDVLPDGFYACEEWPLWFKLHTLHGVQNIWGFSIWRNRPGYRTLGIPFVDWRARHPAKLKILPDSNRVADREFIRDYREIARMAKEAAADQEEQ